MNKPWQWWFSKILALVIGVGGTIIASQGNAPEWWALFVAVAIVIEEWIVGVFPTGDT